jgi:hypothetical protein
MIQVPSENKKLIQTNTSDSLGNLSQSLNLDLVENAGSIRLGSRMLLNANGLNNAPVAFRWWKQVNDDKVFAIAGTSVYSGGTGTGAAFPSTVLTADATTSTPTNLSSDYSDMAVFNGNIYASSGSTTLYYMDDGTTWRTIVSFGSASQVHMLCPFGDRLYMTDLQSRVISINTSNVGVTSGQYTLNLGNSDSNVITFLRASASRIWIGTINTRGGAGHIYEWDGSSSQVTRSYVLESSGVVSGVIKDDILYAMDTNGNLVAWNGGSFRTVASLKTDPRIFYNALRTRNDRWMHPNGMAIVRGRINLLIDSRLSTDGTPTLERTPSGIWEYDPNIGLYHKYSLGLALPAGTITDYGQSRLSRAGAIQEINQPGSSASRNGTFLAGATYYTNASSTSSGAFYDDQNETKEKAGYLVTTKLPASRVSDVWQYLWASYEKLLTATDKIVLKWRVDEAAPSEGTITWTSTTTFTVPNSSVVVSNYWTADTGMEVEVVQGLGAGKCAHITNAVNNAGTWTVTVDETFTGATGTSIARFQNWTKAGFVADQTTRYAKFGLPISANSPWIQVKAWMLFTGDNEMGMVAVDNGKNE